MKQKNTAIMTILFCILIIPEISRAETTISLGGTAWYVWWQPAWADNKWAGEYVYDVTAGYWHEDGTDFPMSSGAMAGPLISIGFLDRWTISAVAVLGQTVFSNSGFNYGMDYYLDAQGLTRKEYRRKVLKWDTDATIGCAVHRYVKLYAGFKAQGYNYRETIHYYDLTLFPDAIVVHSEGKDEVKGYGPGIGIGTSIPLIENLYLQAGLSGVVLWFTEKYRRLNGTYSFDSTDWVLYYPRMPQGKFISYGGTVSLSLAYTIQQINTTLSLGGRYQVLYNRQKYSRYNPFASDVTMNIIDGQYDHFAGITFSAIYTFHIGKKA